MNRLNGLRFALCALAVLIVVYPRGKFLGPREFVRLESPA